MKKKNRQKKTPSITHEYKYTKNELIEIHKEAYYQAMMQINKEQTAIIKETYSPSWRQVLYLIVSVFFFPRHIKIKNVQLNIADSLLSALTTSSLNIIGYFLRFISLCFFVMGGYNLIKNHGRFESYYYFILLWIMFKSIGGYFCASSKELEKERDSNRIYAYTSSIMGILAVIFALISVIISIGTSI
ncbi:MAG: hypothetical protein AB9835_02365 [Eubacteriales bacterium]